MVLENLNCSELISMIKDIVIVGIALATYLLAREWKEKFLYEKRFELNNQLWHSLVELKYKANLLWEKADNLRLKEFVTQLNDTTIQIEKSFLLLKEKDQKKLHNIINEFESFRIGKKELIELKRANKLSHQNIDEIKDAIKHNHHIKVKYENLLNEIQHTLNNIN